MKRHASIQWYCGIPYYFEGALNYLKNMHYNIRNVPFSVMYDMLQFSGFVGFPITLKVVLLEITWSFSYELQIIIPFNACSRNGIVHRKMINIHISFFS